MTATPAIPSSAKADDAFRTIGELADELALPQHILRYWETRFSQLRPLQRAGKRRYYRPADVALVRRIDRLLNHEGYTIRGVQKLLDGRAPGPAEPVGPAPIEIVEPAPDGPAPAHPIDALIAIRNTLATALHGDGE